MTGTEVEQPGGYDLLQQLEAAGALTPTGLTLTDPHLPIGQAEAVGTLLGSMHKAVKFAIGDWLIFIEQVYPQEWSQMAELLDLSEEGRREYRRVSAQVPKSVRRNNVSWSHHRAVAALQITNGKGEMRPDYKAQREWLKKVEDERMSHHALRDALRNGTPPRSSPRSCPCCGRDYEDARSQAA